MNARTLYFHVGMPKTGSTAIQRALSNNRAELAKHALLYPGGGADHAELIALFHQDGADHPYYRKRNVAEPDAIDMGERLLGAVDREIQDFSGDVILSSESFSTLGTENFERLRRHFQDLGLDFRLVVYIRHAVPAAISQANHHIKRGTRQLFECVVYPMWLSWMDTLKAAMGAMDREHIIVRDYDAAKDGDCARDILDACGYRGDINAIEITRTNVGLSMAGALMADACTRAQAADPDFVINRNFVFEIAGPKFTLPDETLAVARERAEEENVWLKENFGFVLTEPPLTSKFTDVLNYDAMLELTRYIGALQKRKRREPRRQT